MRTDQRVKQIKKSLNSCIEPINPAFANDKSSWEQIETHIQYAYVTGHDDMKQDIINAINSMFVTESSVNYGMILNILNKL